jgi:hypothetical protein
METADKRLPAGPVRAVGSTACPSPARGRLDPGGLRSQCRGSSRIDEFRSLGPPRSGRDAAASQGLAGPAAGTHPLGDAVDRLAPQGGPKRPPGGGHFGGGPAAFVTSPTRSGTVTGCQATGKTEPPVPSAHPPRDRRAQTASDPWRAAGPRHASSTGRGAAQGAQLDSRERQCAASRRGRRGERSVPGARKPQPSVEGREPWRLVRD